MTTLTPEQLASYLEAIDVMGGVQVPSTEVAMQIADARPGTMFVIRNLQMTAYDDERLQIEVVDE